MKTLLLLLGLIVASNPALAFEAEIGEVRLEKIRQTTRMDPTGDPDRDSARDPVRYNCRYTAECGYLDHIGISIF